MSRSPRRRLAAILLLAVFQYLVLSQPCAAQAVQPREAWEDTKLYFTAPLRWDGRDWLEFGGTLVLLGVANQADENVRDHFVGDSAHGLDGQDSHGHDDAVPALVLLGGTWLLAGLSDDPAGWREIGSMLEAATLTAVSSEIFKYSLGRKRPNETTDSNQWFKGGDSFPSLHASAAFAIGTVFAESGNEEYRWVRRFVGYGLAGYTAYARVQHNAHWTTDVLAGGALGLSTARFTMNRREAKPTDATTMLVPVDHGLMLTFTKPLR